MKRTLSLVLALLLVLPVLGGLAETAEYPLPEEELVFYLPGDAPANLDAVVAQIEAQLKDTLNVKLNFIYAGWDDNGGKLQMMLAAGQKISLAYDATWVALGSNLAAGYYAPLNDLLEQYAPNLVSSKGLSVFEANMMQGPDGTNRIYAIPLGDYLGRAVQFYVRKDLREALGIAPIQSKEDLLAFAYAVKEAYPDVTPYVPGANAGNTAAQMLSIFNLYEVPGYTWITPVGTDGVFFFMNNDGKVYNIFDDMPEAMWNDILTARNLYQDGVIHPDVMTLSNWTEKITNGTAAISSGGDLGIKGNMQDNLHAVEPEAELESVTFYDYASDGKLVSDFKAWDYAFIPATSTNKERTLMFLDWVAQSQQNYDLCAYGIEGDTWTPVGERQYTIDSSKWDVTTWTWMRNSAYERYDSAFASEDMEHIYRFQDESFFEKSVLFGFNFNAQAVTNEMSQYNVATQKYWFAIQNGVVDPEEAMGLFREEAYEAVAAITREMQAQIDAYLGR